MGKKQKLAPRDVQSLQTFKDPSEVIAINTVKLTEVQLKTWLAMLYHVRNDFKAETHEIAVEKLNELSGYSKKDLKYLKDSMALFCQTVVEFNTLGKSKQNYGGVITSLLAGADFDKRPGYVEFQFSVMLKGIVEKSKMFGNLSLALVRNIETKSGLALYRVLNDYRGIHLTPAIPLETLRGILGVAEVEYPEFKAFNRRVLTPACEQVKAKTDLEVIPHFIRIARKVTAIKFEIIEQEMPLLIKPKTLQNQKKDKKAREANNNPSGHLSDIELLSELKRINERIENGGGLHQEEVKRRSSLKELCKARGLEMH